MSANTDGGYGAPPRNGTAPAMPSGASTARRVEQGHLKGHAMCISTVGFFF